MRVGRDNIPELNRDEYTEYIYDVTCFGDPINPENAEEANLLEKLIDSEEKAISEMEQEPDRRSIKYLTQYYISLASILIRSVPDYYDEAADILDKVYELIEENEPEISDNHCYYYEKVDNAVVGEDTITYSKPK